MTDRIPLPRETADLIGHEQAERRLLQAALSERMPPAWILGGAPGIGKETLAYRFARFLLAGRATEAGGLFGEPPANLYVPPHHPTFRRIASGGHADLKIIERPFITDEGKETRDLNVDAARRIAPFLRRTPAEGGWRVAVVNDGQALNRSSSNAILKILEEPPARSVIILVTDNPGRLLPTIRSRCRRLQLGALAETQVAAFLERMAPDLADTDRVALARLADGSIGRAVALVEEGGLDVYRRLVGLLEPLPRIDMMAVHALGDQIAPAAADQAYRTVTGLLQWWLGRLVRALARGTMPLEVIPGEAALYGRLAAARGLDHWMAVWEKTRDLFAAADSANLDRKVTILTAFMALAAPR